MRRLDSRVYRLEKIGWSRPPRPCSSCGAPKGWVAGFQVQDPAGNPMHEQYCERCGVAVWGGKGVCPIPPGGYREVLVLPAGSEALMV